MTPPNLTSLIATVQTEVGIEGATSAMVTGWINDAYREFVARAKTRMEEVAIGTTVAGTSEYALGADIVDIVEGVLVGSAEYEPVTKKQMWGLKSGRLRYRGGSGVYAQDYSSTAGKQIELWPAPDTSGDTITALAAIMPTALSAGSDTPEVDDDYAPAIISGAAWYGLMRVDERFDEANYHRQFFEQKIEEARRRELGRATGGPVQIQVFGYHYS